MLAIKAYFDGNVFVPIEQMDFKINQPAMIIIAEPATTEKKSCRGIAAKYANPALIAQEESVAALAFSESDK